MNCKVKKNKNGTINSVLTAEGKESRLFEDVNNNLFLGGVSDTSLNVYYTSLTEDVAKIYEQPVSGTFSYEDTKEPRMFYQAPNGSVFGDMEGALISENNNGKFNFGFVNPATGEFISKGTFNTDASPVTSFLTSSVKQGLISTERVYDKNTGESFIQGKGEYEGTKNASARVFKETFAQDLGKVAKTKNEGRISLVNDSGDYIVIKKKDGSTEFATKQQAEQLLTQNNVENKAEIFLKTQNLLDKVFTVGSTKTSIAKIDSHKNNLLGFLKGMGFTVTTLQAYQDAYEMRHGSPTNVAGLVDMANKVVAIAEGQDVSKVITEEVAHLAIEAYSDQQSVAEALLEVVTTPEYREYAEMYRQKYGDELQGIELEEKVRKEILGKVLARELANNETQTATNETIWSTFVNYIKSRFSKLRKTALNNLVANIKKDLGDENTGNFTNTLGNEVYFQLTDNKKITQELKDVFDKLLKLSKTAKKSGNTSVINVRNANITTDSLISLEVLGKINDMMVALKTNLEVLALKNRNNGAEMEGNDYIMFKTLYDQMFPSLEAFYKWTNENEFATTEQKVAKSIETDLKDLMNKFSVLNTSVKDNFDNTYVNLIDQYVNGNENLTEVQKKEVLAGFAGVVKDISSFTRLFTTPSNSMSAMVRMAGKIVTDMDSTLKSNFREFFQESTNSFEKEGWKSSQKSVIAKDSKGKSTYFYEDGVDWTGAEESVNTVVAEYIKTVAPKGEANKIKTELLSKTSGDILERLMREENPGVTQEEIDEEIKKLNKVERKAEYENYTHFYTAGKIENDEKLNEIAEVSEESYIEDEGFRRQINEVKSKYYRDGKFQPQDVSESDAFLIAKVERARRVKRSPIGSSGDIISGLEFISWEEMTPDQQEYFNKINKNVTGTNENFNPEEFGKNFIVLGRGEIKENLNIDARYALDMFNLNITKSLQRKAKGETNERTATDEYKAYLDGLRKKEQFDELLKDSNLEFTDAFYEYNAVNSGALEEAVNKQIEKETDPIKARNKKLALERYKEISKQRSQIFKAYRSSNKLTTEVEVNDLTASTRDTIKEIDTEISSLLRELRTKDMEIDTVDSLTERVLSSSFERMVTEKGKNEYDFALQHMTEDARIRVEKFKQYLNFSIDNTVEISPNKKYEELITKLIEDKGIEVSTLTIGELGDKLASEYAKDNLASYFYGNTLKGLTNVFESMQADITEGNIKTSDLYDESVASRYSEYFKFTPTYTNSVQDVQPEFVDKEYNVLKGRQPRMSKYKNDSFFSKYGVTEEEYNSVKDVTELEARSNTKDFSFLKFAVAGNKRANDIYETNTNIMLRPQLSSSTYEKLKTTSYLKAVANTKDLIKDSFSDRVDEMEYGDQDYNKIGVKVIPKMFRRRLEDPAMITDNTFQGIMAIIESAESYKQKSNTKQKLDAVLEQAMKREYKKGGFLKSDIKVSGEVSETVKAIQELADYYIYGIKQDTKLEFNVGGVHMDMTRFLASFQKYSSYVNLAFTATIPLTSLTTGLYGNAENTLTGDYYSRSASRKGNAEMLADIPKYISSEGKINNKTRMAGLVDLFGIKGMADRLENSASSRAERLLADSPFYFDSLANVPVIFKPLYTLLYDTRYYSDGNKAGYMNYHSFQAYKKTTEPNLKPQDIKNAWESLKNNSFMDALDFNKETGKIKVKQEVIDKIGKEGAQKVINDISSKARIIGQQVDGVLSDTDRVLAQRNVLMNMLMQHRGFLFINLSRAFKGRQYNFHTGNFEEGYARSGAALLATLIKQRGNLAKAFNSLEDLQKANVKRIGLRVALTNLIFLLAMGFRATDDDDEDTYIEDLARIITYRTYNEVDDLSIYGMVKSVYGMVQQPIVLAGTLETAYKVADSVVDDTKEFDWISTRNLALMKSYDQLSDLHGYTNSWLFYKKNELAPIFNYKQGESIFKSYIPEVLQ